MEQSAGGHMSQEIDIFHHRELQELAIHYKTLNWTLHGIFVPMHIGLIGFLATAVITQKNSSLAGMLADAVVKLKLNNASIYALATEVLAQRSESLSEIEIVDFGCLSGVVLVWAWWVISKRQRNITLKLYAKLHELEQYMKKAYPENPLGFDVHVVIDEYDHRGLLAVLSLKTRTIFTILRWLMIVAYAFIAYNIAFDGKYLPLLHWFERLGGTLLS